MSGKVPARAQARAYAAMLCGTVAAFLLIRSAGVHLTAPAPGAGAAHFSAAAPHPTGSSFQGVLLALVVILVAARGLGAIGKMFQQPPVVGEIVAGLMLGPSVLGRLAPHVMDFVFPASVVPSISVIAQVGVILYMFLVGLELDLDSLRGRGHTAMVVSHASITVPFLAGALLALYLYPRLSTQDVPFTVFALFLGVSMSITAFPVLARILTDRGIQATALGRMALTCAAVGDVTAWCLLAAVEGIAQSRMQGIVITLALVALYLGAMLLVVRPVILRAVRSFGAERPLTQQALGAICIALLLSAITTQAIGIHALFGAFFLGALTPHDSTLARDLKRRFEELVIVLFLPAFFAFTGLRAEIGLVSGLGQWLTCGLIIVVASAAKIVGTALAGRATGLPWRQANALGVLMNTRGLMELIVLNIGLDMGVISPALFTMLVLMAVVTTVATTPLLQLVSGAESLREPAGAARVL